jgi:hypothetical protein
VALQSGEGIVGLVPSTGSTVFSIPEKASTIPSAAASGDELFIPANGLTVMKLGAAGEEPKKVWNQTNQRPGTPSVLVGPEKLFLINNAGVLTCASRRDGTVAWEIRLKGPFSGSPVAGGDGKLYIFNEQGVGQVVDTNGEKGVVTSEIELGETILSTPALDGKALYIRSDGYLWKFAAP